MVKTRGRDGVDGRARRPAAASAPVGLHDRPADQADDGQRDDDGDRQLPVEGRGQVRVAGLGEHDREQDQDADGAEVDEDLGGGHDRRAEQRVHPGQ